MKNKIAKLTKILRKNGYIRLFLYRLKLPIKKIKLKGNYEKHYQKFLSDLNNHKTDKKVLFVGVPIHNNLGDQAQYLCIKKWLNNFYKDYSIIEVEDCIICHNYKNIIEVIKKQINEKDIFVFQSGYRTTDVANIEGEYAHQKILNNFTNQVIVFPQTINFKVKGEKQKNSKAYNKNNNYVFLARDTKSFETAKEMYDKERILLYPDIVTSMIGNYDSKIEPNQKDGILLCLRNDDEKLYTDKDYKELIEQLKIITNNIDITDTNSEKNFEFDKTYCEEELYKKLEQFEKFKLIITDRFHGTIFSLITSTPVIVLNSTDHKLSSGVNWFKDTYKDYISYCNDIKDVYKLAENIYKRNIKKIENAYFNDNYYDKLKDKISQINKNNQEV